MKKKSNAMRSRLLVGLLGLLLLSSACGSGGGEPLPTVAGAAALPPTALPSATPLPATLDLAATRTAASLVATPTNTRVVPTATPVNAIVNIVEPDANAVIMMGSEIQVQGLVQKELEQDVWVSLITANGRLLVELSATPNAIGWETRMVIPEFVSGAALLQAAIREQDGTLRNLYQLPVTLVPNTESADRYLVLNRPTAAETAVSGFNLFFDGSIKFPADNTLSLSIWVDNCRTRVARQNFVLGRSNQPFYWQGFVIAPRGVSGPACAVASFGEPGSADWREAQAPITILSPDEADAKGIRIGNPPPGSEIIAGADILVYGTALNVVEGEILISILMENGRIVSQTPATTDYWGYFETTITLPIDLEGPAQIIAETGEGDTFADGINAITILPLPTPTPLP